MPALPMKTKVTKWLLAAVLIVLIVPLAQRYLAFIHSDPANGAYVNAPDVDFSFEKWWDGTYQDGKSKYVNDNIGFRGDIIRVNNQVDYSLFDKLHYYSGEVGTGRCLWGLEFITSYLGTNCVGYDSARGKLWRLKKVQDTLAALGKTFVLIYAPNKAYFYPEYFPERFKTEKKKVNDLENFSRAADSLGINQLDFNALLLGLKPKTKELLYTRAGYHWSMYGATLAGDSLIRYIEKKRGIRMPHIAVAKINHEHVARETDDDLAKRLNLIFPFTTETYSYPEITYPDEEGKQRPKAIYIGDSFLYQWDCLGILNHINAEWQIWFYFTTLFDRNFTFNGEYKLPVKETDWMKTLLNTDYVVMMYYPNNLPGLGNGFIEKAYDHFYPAK